MSKNSWGLRLKGLMHERGISVRAAAKHVGVSPSVILSWQRGRVPNDPLKLKKLADLCGTTISFLLIGENESLHQPTITEMFVAEEFFEGFAKIRIERLIPRKKSVKGE